MITRRGMVGTLGATTGGLLLSAGTNVRADAQDAGKHEVTDPQKSAGRIDVQFHYSPPFYTERLKKVGGYITTDRWSVEAALAYMDKNSVSAGVMSVSTPSVLFLEPAESVSMARKLNDSAAQIAREHPGRFGNFATLPMLDVPATLAEIAYCYDELKMEGVCMMSNVKGHYLGHPSFAPIFDELNKRKAVIFIHPNDPSYYDDDDQVMMARVVEWPFDTTRAAIDLMYSGTIKRCPDIKIILAHAGGALPMVCRRVEEMTFLYAAKNNKDAPNLLSLPSGELGAMIGKQMNQTITQVGDFYYDLAISAHENAIGALRGASNLDHVLFACDWPFAPDVAVKMNVEGFEALKLTPAERYAIERGNAARLFPKLVTA